MDPDALPILRFFQTPAPLFAGKIADQVAEDFRVLAERTAARAPTEPETGAALRRLLEAKDCAIRAVIDPQPVPENPRAL